MSDKKYELARMVAGLCRNCGCRKPKTGCSTCARCLHEKQKTQSDLRAEREERGLCNGCGLTRPARGRKRCHSCLRRGREANRRNRARERAARQGVV